MTEPLSLECPDCQGHGNSIGATDDYCETCQGTGRIKGRPVKPMNEQQCSKCRFWKAIKDNCFGACHRYPPQILGSDDNFTGIWPETHEEDWCGEFQENGPMTEPLSNDRLAEIRAREQLATPGPWDWSSWFDKAYENQYLRRSERHDGEFDDTEADDYFILSCCCPSLHKVADPAPDDGNCPSRSNADFIAHARQDIPDLLAEVERLKAALAVEREACAALAESMETKMEMPDGSSISYGSDASIAAAIRARNG